GVAVGDNGTILRTTDGGAAWQSITSGVEDSLRSVSFNGVNGICGGDSQTILYSTDSGASWQIGQSGFFGGGFPGAQILSATTGFVGGRNWFFNGLFGTPMMEESVGISSPSISTATKVAAMTCSFLTKQLVSFQEQFSTGEALSQGQQMAG